MRLVHDTVDKFAIAGELFSFLWQRKLWWMIPIVMVLVLMGILIVVGSTSGVGPFVYALF